MMPILTPQDAADVLGYDSPDEMPGNVTKILLPGIDGFLKNATGKDWGAEEEIDPEAKMAAGVLLRRWYDDPGMVGVIKGEEILNLIGQLHAKALQEKQAVVT